MTYRLAYGGTTNAYNKDSACGLVLVLTTATALGSRQGLSLRGMAKQPSETERKEALSQADGVAGRRPAEEDKRLANRRTQSGSALEGAPRRAARHATHFQNGLGGVASDGRGAAAAGHVGGDEGGHRRHLPIQRTPSGAALLLLVAGGRGISIGLRFHD